tara:strand:+ start:5089 stop:5466 length:378 start_codon:yes stop_codon:yes gene_type:complete
MKKVTLTILFLFINLNNFFESEASSLQLEIYKNLRCIVCQGQSVAESNSDFAQTIKLVVQDQINEGKSKDEIYDFLISKYGEWIVYKPSFNKTNFLLWLLPYVILIFGLLIIFLILKKRKNSNIN